MCMVAEAFGKNIKDVMGIIGGVEHFAVAAAWTKSGGKITQLGGKRELVRTAHGI